MFRQFADRRPDDDGGLRELGLHLGPAENAVDARMTEVWSLLVSGRLKVMASLTNWFREFRKYHRDDQGSGKIVKRATT